MHVIGLPPPPDELLLVEVLLPLDVPPPEPADEAPLLPHAATESATSNVAWMEREELG